MTQLTLDFESSRQTTLAAPAFLASALVNGDLSGLNSDDLETLERVRDFLGDWEVVDVFRYSNGETEEPWFTWNYSLYGGECPGGECLHYICVRRW